MTDEIKEAVSENVSESSVSNQRFTILDLILVTTALAFFFAMHQRMIETGGIQVPKPAGWKLAFLTLGFVENGLAMSAALLCFARWRNLGTLFRHPGHMLCVYFGLASFFAFGISALSIFFLENETGQVSTSDSVPNAKWFFTLLRWRMIATLLPVSLLLFGLFKDRVDWRLFSLFGFGVLVAMAFRPLIIMAAAEKWAVDILFLAKLINNATAVLGFLASGILVFCIGRDLFSKTRRDWLHWLGCLIFVSVLWIRPLLWMLASRYLSVQDMTVG